MRNELQTILYEKYPELFRQKDLPITESCMCWGIGCGDGWFNLLDVVCEQIQIECERLDIKFEFVQIKEKFSGLRLYYNCDAEENELQRIEGVIRLAEALSCITCENCGSIGERTTDGRWMKTLCKNCKQLQNRE